MAVLIGALLLTRAGWGSAGTTNAPGIIPWSGGFGGAGATYTYPLVNSNGVVIWPLYFWSSNAESAGGFGIEVEAGSGIGVVTNGKLRVLSTAGGAGATVQQVTDATNDLRTTTGTKITNATNDLNTALGTKITNATNDLNTASRWQYQRGTAAGTNLANGDGSALWNVQSDAAKIASNTVSYARMGRLTNHTDVTISGLSGGHILAWNNATGTWTNGPGGGGGGGDVYSGANNVFTGTSNRFQGDVAVTGTLYMLGSGNTEVTNLIIWGWQEVHGLQTNLADIWGQTFHGTATLATTADSATTAKFVTGDTLPLTNAINTAASVKAGSMASPAYRSAAKDVNYAVVWDVGTNTRLSTNADFTITGYSNLDAYAATNWQYSVFTVRNTDSSTHTVTLAAGTATPDGTLVYYVTNAMQRDFSMRHDGRTNVVSPSCFR